MNPAIFLNRYWRSLTWLALVTTLSLMPSPEDDLSIPLIPFKDKIVHFSMYFGLCSLLLTEGRKVRIATQWPVWLLASAYGGLMEIAQRFTETRSADWFDALANTMGATAAVLVVRWLIGLGMSVGFTARFALIPFRRRR